MGKKKKKRSSGKAFTGFSNILGYSFRLLLRSLPLLLVISAGGAAFMGIRSALYADYNLSVQRISVEPAQSLSTIQYQRLESQIIGKNILNVNLEQISKSLEKDPGIQLVTVTRKIPSEIHVLVEKRVAIAFIRFTPTGKYGVISRDGMILDVVDSAKVTGLVMEAVGFGIQQPTIGRQLQNRSFFEAVKFLELYQQQALAAVEPVTKVNLDPMGNVSVVLKEGPEIRLGRWPSQRLESFKKIGSLLESDMRPKIDYIDLQFDDVVVKQKKGVR